MMRSSENRVSRPIVWIASGAIVVGVALMIVSVAVLTGFQEEIRDKVVGFGGHIQVVSNSSDTSNETERVPADQPFYHTITDVPSISHIQQFALKPGILETRENLQGAVIKGVASDCDTSFFMGKMVEGRFPLTATDPNIREVLVSAWQAKRLELKTGSRVRIYLVEQSANIQPRVFEVSGIYETGLEQYDRQFVFIDQIHIARASGWGLEAQIRLEPDTVQDIAVLQGLAFGGDGRYEWHWDNPTWNTRSRQQIDPCSQATHRLVVKDGMRTIPDTAWITVSPGPNPACCACGMTGQLRTAGSSYGQYTGGFEVTISDYDQLWAQDDAVFEAIFQHGFNLKTRNVISQNMELFNWLASLDINVVIIITLVIFISVINMTSALLILILERTRMIGLLKALGITNRSVVGIFLRNAAVIIGRGMLIGNALGLGLCLAQQRLGFITLNPEHYFVDRVPVQLDVPLVLLLNAGTLITCVLFLVLPALYVTRISPVRAIRFD